MSLRLKDNRREGGWAEPQTSDLSGLHSVVLLAGELRTGQLRKQAGRSLLMMPVGSERTVLNSWCDHLVALAEAQGIECLPVRVLVNQDSGMTPRVERIGPIELRIEFDPASFRGTAGLLSDICREEHPDTQLLVANAGLILTRPLTQLVKELQISGGDFALGVHPGGLPSGLMRFRAGCMQAINAQGFVDLNEQVLPELAMSHDVRVCQFEKQASQSIRTLEGYMQALRLHHLQADKTTTEKLAHEHERWCSSFGIIESGAEVAPDAVLHDAVVLSGARVEPGAVLVRTVVCPDAVVKQGQRVIDRLVNAESNRLQAG